MVDDTSAAKLKVFRESGCGCSEDSHFSGLIRGVKLRTPLGMQRERCGNVQVAGSDLRLQGHGFEGDSLESSECTEAQNAN